MDIGIPGSDARANRYAAQSMSGDDRATVRRERTRKWRRPEYPMLPAEHGAKRKPECTTPRSPAHA